MSSAPLSAVIPSDALARIEQSASTVIDTAQALSLSITNDAELAALSDFRKHVIKAALNELGRDFKKIKQGIDAQKRDVMALHERYATPFRQALAISDAAIRQYDAAVKQKQREDAARIQQTLQDAAEREAIERAAEMAVSGDEQERQTAAEILESVAQGEVQPVSTLPALVPVKPKVAGLSLRTLKRFRVMNESSIKREYLMPDEVKIQGVVTDKGKAAEEIVGGIEVYEKTSVASR